MNTHTTNSDLIYTTLLDEGVDPGIAYAAVQGFDLVADVKENPGPDAADLTADLIESGWVIPTL